VTIINFTILPIYMILVSNTEPQNLIDLLQKKAGSIPIKRSPINPGDVLFHNTVIERKTYADLIQSIKSRRIFSQIKRQQISYKDSYLILEMPLLESLLNIDKFYQFIIYIQEIGTKVLFSTGMNHTCSIILLLYNLKVKRTNYSLIEPAIRNQKKILSAKEKKIFFLQGFPLFGRKTCIQILNEFPDLLSFLNSKKSDLKNSRISIGNKRWKSMQKILR
jgi:ERCC4-type nuclease